MYFGKPVRQGFSKYTGGENRVFRSRFARSGPACRFPAPPTARTASRGAGSRRQRDGTSRSAAGNQRSGARDAGERPPPLFPRTSGTSRRTRARGIAARGMGARRRGETIKTGHTGGGQCIPIHASTRQARRARSTIPPNGAARHRASECVQRRTLGNISFLRPKKPILAPQAGLLTQRHRRQAPSRHAGQWFRLRLRITAAVLSGIRTPFPFHPRPGPSTDADTCEYPDIHFSSPYHTITDRFCKALFQSPRRLAQTAGVWYNHTVKTRAPARRRFKARSVRPRAGGKDGRRLWQEADFPA